jgi:hypothetical protein
MVSEPDSLGMPQGDCEKRYVGFLSWYYMKGVMGRIYPLNLEKASVARSQSWIF